jgi:NADPH-dependent stearoyl-CoA 9-desaturase
MFEWGIALHGLHSEHDRAATDAEKSAHTRALIRKIIWQAGKDYVLMPALSLRRWRRTLGPNVAANLLRNVWAYVVISCGHFADGAEKFTPAALEDETKPEWYLRQMLGTANFRAGPVLAFLSGDLCYHINTTLSLISRATATRRSPNGFRPCAPPMTCPTRPDRWLASTCSPCAPFSSWRFRIGSSPRPPMTPPKRRRKKSRNLEAPQLSGGTDDNTRRRRLVTAIRHRQNRRRASISTTGRWPLRVRIACAPLML